MKTVDSEKFEEEILRAEKPVLLEFYSDSCIPCKRMSPILSELEQKYGDISFFKLNIQFGKEKALEYGVMASPTILLFKDGKEVGRIRGLAKKAEIEALLGEVGK